MLFHYLCIYCILIILLFNTCILLMNGQSANLPNLNLDVFLTCQRKPFAMLFGVLVRLFDATMGGRDQRAANLNVASRPIRRAHEALLPSLWFSVLVFLFSFWCQHCFPFRRVIVEPVAPRATRKQGCIGEKVESPKSIAYVCAFDCLLACLHLQQRPDSLFLSCASCPLDFINFMSVVKTVSD